MKRVNGFIRDRAAKRKVWVRRYVVFHGRRHPTELDAHHVSEFLSWLATVRHVSASTQNQALGALLFLYRKVLSQDLGAIASVVRARTPERLPVVLSRGEVAAVLGQLRGQERPIVSLLYGSGLRLTECLELRVKDIDFDRQQIIVRRGKGAKDRATMLPVSVRADLSTHLAVVKRQHDDDLRSGLGRVVLPFAVERKYPAVATHWSWQFVFPAARVCRDARWGPPSRFHLHETAVQRVVSDAVRRAGLNQTSELSHVSASCRLPDYADERHELTVLSEEIARSPRRPSA